MTGLPKEIQKLVNLLTRLPNFGPKSSERVALYFLKSESDFAKNVANAILDLKNNVRLCRICQSFASDELCSICEDSSRDKSIICVVEDPLDVYAIERGNFFGGVYHVLHGAIDPINHIEPEELKISELQIRVETEKISEIILATNPNAKGETTAIYLEKLFKNFPNLKITRIAYGLPRGAEIEFADELTIKASIQNRNVV